jgi:hypothetical protein
MRRRVALVGPIDGERRTVHTAGYPLDPDDMLPPPDVLLLIEGRDGCMLFRYTAHGEFGGDTPHDSALQAEAQAQMEYGDALLAWIDVPADVADAHAFAVRYAFEEMNERE